jgi:hypothetical protein
MQENMPMTTSISDAENYGNVLPGYTLPIRFFDRVMGRSRSQAFLKR